MSIVSTRSTFLLDVPGDGKPISPDLNRLSGSSRLANNCLDEVWPHLTSDLRMKFNDQMLDVILESLIAGNSKMTRQRSSSLPTRVMPLNPHSAELNDITMGHQLFLATQRIAQLERKIYDNQVILRATTEENQCLKKDKAKLEVRVKDLAMELELRDAQHEKSEEMAKKGLEEMVEGMVRERDEARGIVSEIQRLSSMVNGSANPTRD